eukprot:scaffold17426_cov170-Amphora_coffeaeformis.AAC.1
MLQSSRMDMTSPFAMSFGSTSHLSTGSLSQHDTADGYNETVLGTMLESGDWAAALSRIATHPAETQSVHDRGRRPLHLACADDAPAVVVQALMKAYPAAATMVGTTGMTPLHLTCSSDHASVHVVRVLLEQGEEAQCKIQDLDGDTPLHAAARSGAPLEVLKALLVAHPAAANERDYEGLTPLLRLWVRYVVTLGDDALENIVSEADLTGELGEAWRKTELLLRCAHQGKLEDHQNQHMGSADGVLHAASAVDCPRSVIKVAARIFSHQLSARDKNGLTPLLIAAQAPIFKVRDLSDDGYFFEDVVHGDGSSGSDNGNSKEEEEDQSADTQPSVIDILLQANQGDASAGACFSDPAGRLPLHLALNSGKKWNQGVLGLAQVHPEGLACLDPTCNLYPFLLAAEGQRSDLNTVYEVLRFDPSVLSDLLDGKLTGHKKTCR